MADEQSSVIDPKAADLGKLVASATHTLGQIMNEAFTLGVREGLEMSAQMTDVFTAACATFAQVDISGYMTAFRDQVRLAALQIETPATTIPEAPR
jgi:hypothetical protein